MSVSGVYYWLGKVKASHKIPRKIHDKQDPDEKESFKKDIVEKFQELDIPAGRPVRVWIQDEHRYGAFIRQGHRHRSKSEERTGCILSKNKQERHYPWKAGA